MNPTLAHLDYDGVRPECYADSCDRAVTGAVMARVQIVKSESAKGSVQT